MEREVVEEFKTALQKTQGFRDSLALVEQGQLNPILNCWLVRSGYLWMMSHGYCMTAVKIIAQRRWQRRWHSTAYILMEHNDEEILDAAEQRGLDVRQWNAATLAKVLVFYPAAKWLSARVNIEEKILAEPQNHECWRLIWRNRFNGDMLAALAAANYSELLAHVLCGCRALWSVKKVAARVEKAQLLANNGALLRLLLRHKYMRAQKIKILRQHGFSQSDFVSIGIQIN
jgi:hypothetical protein